MQVISDNTDLSSLAVATIPGRHEAKKRKLVTTLKESNCHISVHLWSSLTELFSSQIHLITDAAGLHSKRLEN